MRRASLLESCGYCKERREVFGLHCDACRLHLYLVQAPSGERFLVDTLDGTRWCSVHGVRSVIQSFLHSDEGKRK